MNLQENIKRILREEVLSQDKETTLEELIKLMGPSKVRQGNRVVDGDDSAIKYSSRMAINVDYVNQETLDKINDFMDDKGWFPTNIKLLDGFGKKYSVNVNSFLGKKDVIIIYESKNNFEMIPNKTKAYHVTPDIYVNNILEKGLTPKTESKLSDHPERIYLMLNSENSKSMSEILWNTLDDEIKKLIKEYYVLEIDLEQLPNNKYYLDPASSIQYRAIYTLQPIPKSAIKVINKILVNDFKPIMSQEEEEKMWDELSKNVAALSKSEPNPEMDATIKDIMSRIDDDDTISLDDLLGLKESIRRVIREESDGKKKIKNLVLKHGWKTVANNLGGFKELFDYGFNNDYKEFLNLYSNLNITDGDIGYFKTKNLSFDNGDTVIMINTDDNEGMISQDKIWSFFKEFGLSHGDISKLFNRWLNETYDIKVYKSNGYYTVSPDDAD